MNNSNENDNIVEQVQVSLDMIIDIAILDYQSQSVRLVSCQVPIDRFVDDERIEMELKALGYSIDDINYMYSHNISLSDERGM